MFLTMGFFKKWQNSGRIVRRTRHDNRHSDNEGLQLLSRFSVELFKRFLRPM